MYQKNLLNNQEIKKELREPEYKKDGVFVGRDKWGRDLIDNSSGHIMMIAKTGEVKEYLLFYLHYGLGKGQPL